MTALRSSVLRTLSAVVLAGSIGACSDGDDDGYGAISDASVAADAAEPDAAPDLCADVDCSSEADACNSAACDPEDGACVKTAINETGACDADACYDAETCTAGECGGGTLVCPTDLAFTAGDATGFGGDVDGGTLYPDDCPAGQFVVGIDGEVDGFFRKLAVVCGTPTYSGVTGIVEIDVQPGETLPLRGTQTGTEVSSRCPEDQVVVGFGGRGGLLVDAISLHCAPLTVDGSYAVAIGPASAQPQVGGEGGSEFTPILCAADQLATGANIRAGDSVDGFGLRCSTVDAQDDA